MITKDYVKFFKGLEKNNNKEWFHEHKNEYDTNVRKPFIQLVEALISEVSELDPLINIEAKDSLFRINRDIRFSKDKTPYNTIMKASLAPGGKKSILPGFYLGIDSEKIHLGGGLYNISTADLKEVRYLIASDSKEFLKIVNSKSFKSSFGELQGEKAKRIDKDLLEAAEDNPYIFNKQFYAMANLPLSDYVDTSKIKDTIVAYFKDINPLNQYLKRVFIN